MENSFWKPDTLCCFMGGYFYCRNSGSPWNYIGEKWDSQQGEVALPKQKGVRIIWEMFTWYLHPQEILILLLPREVPCCLGGGCSPKGRWEPCALLGGMCNGAVAMASSTLVPQKLKIQFPYVPVSPLLGIYSKELKIGAWIDICIPMFTAWFTTAKRWKHLECPSTDVWVN